MSVEEIVTRGPIIVSSSLKFENLLNKSRRQGFKAIKSLAVHKKLNGCID